MTAQLVSPRTRISSVFLRLCEVDHTLGVTSPVTDKEQDCSIVNRRGVTVLLTRHCGFDRSRVRLSIRNKPWLPAALAAGVLLVFSISAHARGEWPDGPNKQWLESLERPDNAQNPYRKLDPKSLSAVAPAIR